MYKIQSEKSMNDTIDLPLMTGQQMDQAAFHHRYLQMPLEYKKVELIDGIVFVAEPTSLSHATRDCAFSSLLGVYAARTPGVMAAANGTVILGEKDEVQPDSFLILEPEYGGQTQLIETQDYESTEDDEPAKYVYGGPELVVEIAYSSRSIDLGTKRLRYAEAGVKEFLVFDIHAHNLQWFSPPATRARKTDDGIYRSEVFPGLWIHSNALLRRDNARALDVLNDGIASAEHQQFVELLKSRVRT